MNCPKCGSNNPDGSVICQTCHEELNTLPFNNPPNSKKPHSKLKIVISIVIVLAAILAVFILLKSAVFEEKTDDELLVTFMEQSASELSQQTQSFISTLYDSAGKGLEFNELDYDIVVENTEALKEDYDKIRRELAASNATEVELSNFLEFRADCAFNELSEDGSDQSTTTVLRANIDLVFDCVTDKGTTEQGIYATYEYTDEGWKLIGLGDSMRDQFLEIYNEQHGSSSSSSQS